MTPLVQSASLSGEGPLVYLIKWWTLMRAKPPCGCGASRSILGPLIQGGTQFVVSIVRAVLVMGDVKCDGLQWTKASPSKAPLALHDPFLVVAV